MINELIDGKKQTAHRCLILTDEYFNQTGAGLYMKGWVSVFEFIFGKENVFVGVSGIYQKNYKDNLICIHKFENSIPFRIKLKNIFSTGYSKLEFKNLKEIEDIIDQNKIDILVLGRTTYGFLAYIFKRRKNVKIISVCHDVAVKVLKECIRGNKFTKLPGICFSCIQEYMAVRYSDRVIVLNEREKLQYINVHHKEPDAVIPIFCIDTFNSNKIQSKGVKCNLLFIGTDYWPNMNGIIWFIQNVMNHLDNRFVLYVIGRNIDKIEGILKQSYDNVKIIGTVDSVDSYYYNADIVVGPIFFGSGMKTKTVEALMFGKTYLGTKEALEGYIGMEDYLCNTADEFINKIHSFYEKEGELRFNQYSRSLFENYYSKEAIKKQIYSIL